MHLIFLLFSFSKHSAAMHMSLFLWLASVLIVRVGGQMGFMFLSLLLPHVLSGS